MQYTIFPQFNEDEEKKKRLAPSQIAREGQKAKYNIFPELNTPFVAPKKKVEEKPPVQVEEKPSFLKKAKEAVTGLAKGVVGLFKPKIVSPIPEEEMIKPPTKEITPVRQFKAGIGDVLATAGAAANWLGQEGIGTKFAQSGAKLQALAPEELKQFEWKDLYDPSFYSTRVARALPFSLSLMPVAIIGGYAGVGTAGAIGLGTFGKTVLGSIGAGLLSRPMEAALEAGSTFDEQRQKGKSIEEADKAADKTFKLNLGLTGMDIAEFLAAFAPIKGGGKIVKALKRTAGIAGNVAMEGAEEVIQRNIQLAAQNEPLDITSRQAQEEFAIGGLMGGMLGVTGSIFERIKGGVRDSFSAEYQKEFSKNIQSGLNNNKAEINALDTIAQKHPKEAEKVIKQIINQVTNIPTAETPATMPPVIKEALKTKAGEEIEAPTIPPVGEGKEVIPKELEPLAQEARKYKSAEEFVKDLGVGNKKPFFIINVWDPELGKSVKMVSILEEGNLKQLGITPQDFYIQATGGVGVKGVEPALKVQEAPTKPELKEVKIGDIFVSTMGRKITVEGFKNGEAIVDNGQYTIRVSSLKGANWEKIVTKPTEKPPVEVEEKHVEKPKEKISLKDFRSDDEIWNFGEKIKNKYDNEFIFPKHGYEPKPEALKKISKELNATQDAVKLAIRRRWYNTEPFTKEELRNLGVGVLEEKVKPPVVKKPTIAEAAKLVAPVGKLIAKTRKVAKLPKTDEIKIYNRLNKSYSRRSGLSMLENVCVKDGKLHLTDLSVSVLTPTKSKDGIYRVIGQDFLPQAEAKLEDYPEAPKLPKERKGRILLENIADIYKKFPNFTNKDTTRPLLEGVRFEAKNSRLRVTATDGYRLFIQNYGLKIDNDFAFTLDGAQVLSTVIPVLKEEGPIEIYEGKNEVFFTDGESQVSVRKIEGEFPDISQITPSFEQEIVVDKKALLQAVKEITPYTKDRANIMFIDIGKDELTIRAKLEEAEKKISVPIRERKAIKLKDGGVYAGSIIMPVKQEELPASSIAFNYKFINDSLKALDGEDVFLRLHEEKGEINPNSPVHLSDEAEEPFYVKKKPIEEVVKAPAGYADKGEYAKLENLSIEKNKINIVEFPELVTIARQLDGIPSVTKRLRSKGAFNPDLSQEGKRIRLNPDIFKDPVEAAKVMAHELGHLADFLPQKMMQRGNLVGRIASLNRYLKHKYGELKNPVIRGELQRLSQLWKPFDETESENYTKYRYSSAELYADAISVLFNDPARLKQDAPNFWKGFFDYIDQKPEVKENFFATWELLSKGEEAVLSKRQKSIRDSFKRGEDQFVILQEERKKRQKDFVFRLKYELIDKNQAVIDLVNKTKKEGKPVNDDDNPVYWLEEQNYVGGVVKHWMETGIQPVYKEVTDAGLTWEDFGEVLFHERVMNERGELANPLGFNPKTSGEQLEYLKRKLGGIKWNALQKNLVKYRVAIQEVTKKAEEAELYSPELIKEMKANPAYATFQVIDYMDLYIPASIKKQIGTLKEITNPATATVMKSVSIIRAAERNMAKRKLVDFLHESAQKEIKDARTRWTGKRQEPMDSREPDEKLFTLMEEGKVKGYYVDPYIASTFDYLSTGTTSAMVSTLKFFNSKLFRPLFITFNLGFQSFNLMRDFSRFYKNTPHMSIMKAFIRYAQSVPAARARGWELPNKTIQEMEKSKLLGVTYNDLVAGRTNADKQIERVIERVGLSPLKGKKTLFFLKPFKVILDTIENLGDAIETLPKVAGYKELNGKLPPKELGSFIRTSVGSPDFLRRGAGYGWYNEVFLFSNAIKEGIRADFNTAFKNPKTRVGYWWKTMLVTFLPKMVMFGGLMGLFGVALKKMLEDVSEYDKTNYTIIPFGRKNGLTSYLRIPQDETGRLLGGILWKALRISNNNKPILSDVSDLLSYTGGQLPSVSPIIEALSTTAQFVAGKNPYDFFRGRSVIPDDAFEAGGMYSLKPFITWQINQLGGGVFWKSYLSYQSPTTKDWLQKTVEAPLLSNIIGRWIKVSNYGQKERNTEIIKGVGREAAQRRIEERDQLNEAIKEYQSGTQNMTRRLQIERKLVKDILGNPPYKGTEKAKETNLKKKFKIGIIKGEADQNINAVISATTNEEKVTLLREIKNQLDDKEYKELIDTLTTEKIISKNVLNELKKSKLQSYVPTDEEFKLMDIFKVKEAHAAEKFISPLGTDEKGKQIPYKLEKSDKEGYVKFIYPSGAYSEIKAEDIPKYGALVQKNYKLFGQGEYPSNAPNWLATTIKKILPSSKGATQTPFNEEIKESFGEKWKEATRVLRYQDETGDIHGENVGFQTGREVDIPNRIDPKTGKWDKNAPIAKVKNPFSGNKEDSVDRGLFRITNGTFYTLLNSELYRKQIKEAGIISSSSLNSLDATTVAKAWDKMLDPKLNIKMARIIYNYHEDISGNGWSGWFASPPELRLARR